MKTLVLIRGISGSGKTTLGKSLSEMNNNAPHYEADSYFYDASGNYRFYPEGLKQAHEKCMSDTDRSMQNGEPLVIVSNTFTRYWEFDHYLDIANQEGYSIEVIEMKNSYGSVHSIPESILNKQKNRFQSLRDRLCEGTEYTDYYDYTIYILKDN